MKWAYGVTTVPMRSGDLLPRTLKSLRAAGFESPRLFVDGAADSLAYIGTGLECTCRYPLIKTYGNWILSLAELYIRAPTADRYAIFQDDFVTYRNLREYLERSPYPQNGYLNLYTFPENQKLAPTDHIGWYPSNQFGRGAVALVFSREAVLKLLGMQSIIQKPQTVGKRGWKSVDGAVVTAMKIAGWKEYVHNPSLVQHTGHVSSMENKVHKLAESFRGEDFDALELLHAVK